MKFTKQQGMPLSITVHTAQAVVHTGPRLSVFIYIQQCSTSLCVWILGVPALTPKVCGTLSLRTGVFIKLPKWPDWVAKDETTAILFSCYNKFYESSMKLSSWRNWGSLEGLRVFPSLDCRWSSRICVAFDSCFLWRVQLSKRKTAASQQKHKVLNVTI